MGQLSCASHVERAPSAAAPQASTGTRAEAVGWEYRGMTFISWTRDGYTRSSTLTSMDQMVAHNVEWVSIVPHWFMDNKNSNTVYADPLKYTPTDDSVRYIIQQAHNRGLKVMLKPHVDPKDGTWRGSITPTDPSAWFASYRSFLLHYAQIAADTGAELFSMSNELRSMTIGSTNAPRWRSLVSDVRHVYPGKLTAAANWGPQNWAEYLRVQWWDAVDYIGINGYFALTGEEYPTVDMAKAGWFDYMNPWNTMEHWVSDVQGISARLGGKKVLFTEMGYNSNPTAGDPWYTDGPNVPSMQSQKNCVEAAFQVWQNRSFMVGGFWWEWSLDPNAGGSGSTSMVLNNKPAADTIAAWFGGQAPPPPDTAVYGFEGGTQGWFRSERCVALQSGTTVAYEGQRSLRCQLSSVGGSAPGYAAVSPPSSLTGGRTVTMQVYLEGGATNVTARAYVQNASRAWTKGTRVTLRPSAWTQISVTVPSSAPLPLYRLGIQFQTSTGAFSGYADVDAVQW